MCYVAVVPMESERIHGISFFDILKHIELERKTQDVEENTRNGLKINDETVAETETHGLCTRLTD